MSIATVFAIVGGVVVIGVSAFIEGAYRTRHDAPYPQVEVRRDAAAVARGKYIAYGPGHCVSCHTPMQLADDVQGGQTPALMGGYRFATPIGTFWGPNLTPDRETGIGAWTDQELARALRHNVGRDGRTLMPTMRYMHLADDDLAAVIAFLRSQPAIRHEVPRRDLNALGKTAFALMLKPEGPSEPILAKRPAGPTIENGRYLANNVANCVACHTPFDMSTFKPAGPIFSGGVRMEPLKRGDPAHVTPNLTPDPKTGHIYNWTEETFVARFRSGWSPPGTHMPWGAYKRLSEDDLRAIWRYLRSLPPAEHDVDQGA